MNKQDAFKIIMVLKAVYNNAFSRYTEKDYDNLAGAWAMCLEDYSYNAVSMAVKAYMTTNCSQFPPVPAQIIEQMQRLSPSQELNANEAWALVYKAICNSAYSAQAEFEKLPPTVQKAVGSADNLKAWATDAEFNIGVEQSHFTKTYSATVAREKELQKLPQSVKEAIGIQTTAQERIGAAV